jgi:hypothetical protein
MADTKNYGLKGVGDDVQFGKAGGRFVYNTGASDFRATTDGSTLSHLQVLTPIGDTDAATKLYVDNIAAGLDPKEACRCATTAAGIGTYATTPSNGQFTSVAASIDGVTLAQGDRVLVKDQADQKQNGIYEVQATTTTLTRASDMDGTPAGDVSGGNFTFVEEGTLNINSGWVLQGDGILTLNTDNLVWVQFSGAGSITLGVGLLQTGNVADLSFVTGGGMTNSVATVAGDFVAFSDTDNSDAMQLRSWTNILADLDIVNGGGNGILTRTAADTYTGVTMTAAGTGNSDGIIITNGDGTGGNPTFGVDIVGTPSVGEAVVTGDTLLLYNVSNTANEEVTVDQLKTFMNAGTSSTSITEGDTTLAVSDSGSDGTLTFTADATQVFTVTDTTAAFENGLDLTLDTGGTITVTDLTENDVMIVGASGLIEDSAGALTFNGTTLGVTGAATVSTDLTVGESVYVTEQASAGADTGGDGQIWVRSDAPNTLMFTDDVGNDFTANNVLEIAYEYDSVVTTSDPGAGKLNFNSVTIGSITTLYINDADNTARDNSFLLANLAIGDVLTFRSASDPADYIVASISSVTDSTGFWTIGLTLIHTGAIFTDIDEVRISVEWQSKGVGAVPTLITVADSSDSTSFPAFFESATGDLGPKTDSQLIYNATSGQLGATSFISTALTDNDVLVAGSGGVIEDSAGALTFSGTELAVTGSLKSSLLTDNDVLVAGTAGIIEDSAGNFTWSGTILALTGAMDITGDLDVDNININGDTISNTNTDSGITIQPNGTGAVTFLNGSGEEMLELLDAASALNHLAITAGGTGVAPLISANVTGSETNVDIGFLTKGTGALTVDDGAGTYETRVTDDDDIPNKKYVDDAVTAVGISGALDTVTATVSLTAATTVNIGGASGIPDGATIMSVVLEVDVAADDAASTVTVGDATNGAASYMAAAENDPEILGTYIANTYVANSGAARQAIATVAVPATTGSTTCIITFRRP